MLARCEQCGKRVGELYSGQHLSCGKVYESVELLICINCIEGFIKALAEDGLPSDVNVKPLTIEEIEKHRVDLIIYGPTDGGPKEWPVNAAVRVNCKAYCNHKCSFFCDRPYGGKCALFGKELDNVVYERNTKRCTKCKEKYQ